MEKTFTLNAENFFDEIKAECPTAYALFSTWIDAYKDHIKWSGLFGEATSVTKGGELRIAPKFHEVPFDMQRGIIQTFFRTQYLQVMTVPHDKGAGFAYQVIDMERGYLFLNFVDDANTAVAFYQFEPVCMVDAMKRSFIELEEKLLSNKKFEE